MNVLHVHSGNMFGGVERMLETLAPAHAGVSPLHSAYALCFSGRTADALEQAGGTVYPLGAVHSRRVDEIWRARRALKALLSTGAWNVVCVHSAWSQGLFGGTILKSGVPLVRWLHAPEPGPAWLETWSARTRPALVICNSHYTCDASGDRFGTTPVVICHPPARPLTPRPHARADIRRAMGTADETVVIAMAARMEAQKGHEVLIESLKMVPGNGWQAWILGGPQNASERAYMDALQARSESLDGRIRFLGERPDVDAWLQAADVYCQPNRSPDSFGLSFVEALSAGLPVVTTNIGGAAEIVTNTCGVLTMAESPSEVASALGILIEDRALRRRMGEAARERVQEFCDLPRSVRRLADLLGCVARPSTTAA